MAAFFESPFLAVFIVIAGFLISEVKNADTAAEDRALSENEKIRDESGFRAIQELHRQMDDDHSGSIDLQESGGFVHEELHIKDAKERQKAFHHDDTQISVDDLWDRWVRAAERKWDVAETVKWLTDTVELPQYAANFEKYSVRGEALPKYMCLQSYSIESSCRNLVDTRLASQNFSFISTVLGIQNPVHRRKLQLKAIDVVLFGKGTEKRSLLRDVVLSSLLLLALIAYYFRSQQARSAQRELERLTDELNGLSAVEQDLFSLQKKVKEFDEESLSSNGRQEEIEKLRSELEKARTELETRTGTYAAPLALQPLLRKSYQVEQTYINEQKKESIAEMHEAKDALDKLRKKQGNILSQVRAITQGYGAEDVEQKIVNLKNKIQQTVKAMEELQQRWSRIERLCGFPIMSSSGRTIVKAGFSVPEGNDFLPAPEGTLERTATEPAFQSRHKALFTGYAQCPSTQKGSGFLCDQQLIQSPALPEDLFKLKHLTPQPVFGLQFSPCETQSPGGYSSQEYGGAIDKKVGHEEPQCLPIDTTGNTHVDINKGTVKIFPRIPSLNECGKTESVDSGHHSLNNVEHILKLPSPSIDCNDVANNNVNHFASLESEEMCGEAKKSKKRPKYKGFGRLFKGTSR